MSAIQTRGVKFINSVIDGVVVKSTNGTDSDMGFITFYNDAPTINEILSDIDKALNNQISLIEDVDISNDIGVAFITVNGIEFRGLDGQNVVSPNCPLQDFKELLIGWRDFLQTPPYEGSAVK